VLAAVALWPAQLLLYAIVVLFGLMQGARGPIVVAMVTQLFPGGVGAIYGALSLAQGFGAGLGSWISGGTVGKLRSLIRVGGVRDARRAGVILGRNLPP
jgi:hypothetical protein